MYAYFESVLYILYLLISVSTERVSTLVVPSYVYWSIYRV